MPHEHYADDPSPEVAAERDRIVWILNRLLASPDAPGARSRAYTAINNGLSPDQVLSRSWGHPWNP